MEMVEVTSTKRQRKPRTKKADMKQKEDVVHVPKKRGRKPKGGKIVKKDNVISIEENVVENQVIILHLKCKTSDLDNHDDDTNINCNFTYDPHIIKEVKAYTKSDEDSYYPYNVDTVYNVVSNDKSEEQKNNKDKNKDKKNISKKLKELEQMFNCNKVDKKSSCFWCTCDFTSPAIYIPSLFFQNKYDVYGCFCSPECASSYLFRQNIDDNTKFERYQLLNYLYGKVYGYEKEIKFAPDPYHTLNKYYGNLTIQEYRQLLDYDRLILVIDKPVSKIYPEIHEDNNDFETVYDNKLSLKKGPKTHKNDVLNSVFSSHF